MSEPKRTSVGEAGHLASDIPGLRASKPFLGDRKVVAGVLNKMLQAVADDPEAAPAAIDEAVGVLSGQDESYAPMGPWNSGDGLGNWIRGNMNGVPDGDTADAVEFALAHLVLHYLDGVKHVDAGHPPADVARRLGTLRESWTNLMLGIPSQAGKEPE